MPFATHYRHVWIQITDAPEVKSMSMVQGGADPQSFTPGIFAMKEQQAPIIW
jgi:hypothetical protein